jgi:hypothetical protein
VNVGHQALISAVTRTAMSETCQPRRQANCAFPCLNPFPRQARLPVAGENAVITLMQGTPHAAQQFLECQAILSRPGAPLQDSWVCNR